MPLTLRSRANDVSSRMLGGIERVGNKLPHPFILFVHLALLVIVASGVTSLFDVTVENPESGETEPVRSLLTGDGLVYMLTSALDNFVQFPPLGLVVVMMLGIGLAQQVGLIESAVKRVILAAPPRLVTAAVVLTGICGNLASDAAFIVIPPLAALVFRAVGRHPLAGLAAGFTAAGAGFSANFFVAGTDVLLSGISTEAAGIVDSGAEVSPVANWYFMVASVVVLTLIGVFVTEKIVEPRLGTYRAEDEEDDDAAALERSQVTPEQRRGLRNALLASGAYLLLVVACVVPSSSPLRGEGGSLVESPLLDGIVPLLFLLFVVGAVAYGVTVNALRSSGDVPRYMAEAAKNLGGFLVLIFAAAQAIAYFEWSRLGLWVAVNGAELMESLDVSGVGGLVGFSLITLVLSLLIASGSGLWAIEAPIFVPMFMLQDVNPAYVQLAYRIADSSTNCIVPLSPYVAIMLGFIQQYDRRAGLGTLFALVLPYTVAFYLGWMLLFVAWLLLGIPIGPGEALHQS
ncbi:AbgT family transporter [Streptomyces sp. DSM 42041]|uniref:AbgT family transporter n=1 Tax=Streptomyces hazeniae TaxID=3075538 RepID=A0ABU2NMM2_9ACTN|nr:AbgT family transporter [Streptomyces sp. DSM 42041]MDT0378193.1 AbgT family transporter [Streptomyces sp. DSM 42041]